MTSWSHPSSSPFIYGIHPLHEALTHGYTFKKVLIKTGKPSSTLEGIIGLCKTSKIPFFFVHKTELDQYTLHANHQGVVAFLKEGPRLIDDFDSFVAKLTPQAHVLLAVDGIQDPHNLGAIIRTACFFGVKAMVLDNTHQAPINETVHKVSSGASLMMSFHITHSMQHTLHCLRKHHYYLVAAHIEDASIPIEALPPKKKYCLIMGSEGRGIRPALLSLTDQSATIQGNASHAPNSLNVSVATGICLHSLKNHLDRSLSA